MKKYWASAILFWTLAFALQKKLFIRFWKKVFEIVLKFFIGILDIILFLPRAIKNQYNNNHNNDILRRLDVLEERIITMELNVSALAAEVARVHTVQSSAATLLKKLTGELEKVSAELAAKASETIDTKPLDDLIEQLKASTDALAGAVADSSNVIPTKEVILHADDPTVPTVQVNLPEVMPEVVTVSAETVVDTVDTTSAEPQVVVTVLPADDTTVTEEDVVADVIKTDEGQVDVVVTAPSEVAEAVKAEANVDVVDAVKEAFDVTPEVVAEPVVEAPKTE